MKLKILTALAGATFTYATGDTVDLDDKAAGRLIAAGYAEPIKAEPTKPTRGNGKSAPTKLETATAPAAVPLETATDPNL